MDEIKEWLDVSSGDGSGSGTGDGFGYGSGTGYGFGSGSGSGFGTGFGSGSISSFNHQPVYSIDDVNTLIDRISHGFAIGHILKKDFSLVPCVVAKNGRFFAHGETVKEAVEALRDKMLDGMTEDERIAEFWKCHNRTDAYSGHDLYDWHHKLTGSCEFGRKQFISDHGLSLDATYTVEEFIRLCEHDYGGRVIQRLKQEVRDA